MTDKQRIEILEKVKMLISDGEEYFICNAISEVLETHYNRKFLTDIEKVIKRVNILFPELAKYKPKSAIDIAWFEYHEKEPRLKIIDSMITDIKSKSND